MNRSPQHRARALGAVGLSLLVTTIVAPTRALAAPTKRDAMHGSASTLSRLVRSTSRLPSARRTGAIPVTITFDGAFDAARIASVEALGGVIARERGVVLGRGDTVSAELPDGVLDAVAKLPQVRRVALDGPIAPLPRPLDQTTALVGAQATWADRSSPMTLDGTGMTICDVDSGIDVTHPLFFRADGGAFAWTDVDGNGAFTPGVDTVDLGEGPVPLGVLEGIVSHYWSEDPILGSEDPKLDPTLDYLYADKNGNGSRDVGKKAGFTEADPTYGERLFVIDDVDGDGKLDVGEKLFALGTSKIKAFRVDTKTYRRGENLIDAPWTDSMQHGTGASGILVAGTPGLTRLVGMAPGADLVMATDTVGQRDYQMTQFCIKEGARVVLHEYAPWVGYPLDGSTPTEKLIDSSSLEGVSHVNPAGNLSTSEKLYKHTVPSGQVTTIPVEVPPNGAYFLAFTLIWQDGRDLGLSVQRPDGSTIAVDASPTGSQVEFVPGVSMYAYAETTDRGTRDIVVYIVSDGSTLPPDGNYALLVADGSPTTDPDLPLVAYVMDDVSGWGTGARFTEFTSEDHLVGYPGTADHGMPVSAFTGRDIDGATVGERAFYSGRGFRIDGKKIMWVSGPDNPVSALRFDDRDLAYAVFGGTSGASPHVAGAAALVLQHAPMLDGDGVKAAIEAGATTDAFTGSVPNDDFGWGKLNVYRSVFGKDVPSGSAPTLKVDPVTMAPGTRTVSVSAADPDQPFETLELSVDKDYDGTYDEVATNLRFDVTYDAPGTYFEKLRLRDDTGRAATALLRVDVTPGGAGGSGGGGAGGASTEGYSLAGGGCAFDARGADAIASLAGFVGLALVSRLRTRRRGRG